MKGTWFVLSDHRFQVNRPSFTRSLNLLEEVTKVKYRKWIWILRSKPMLILVRENIGMVSNTSTFSLTQTSLKAYVCPVGTNWWRRPWEGGLKLRMELLLERSWGLSPDKADAQSNSHSLRSSNVLGYRVDLPWIRYYALWKSWDLLLPMT